MKGDNPVVWNQWLDAARWDEETHSHLHPNSSEKNAQSFGRGNTGS